MADPADTVLNRTTRGWIGTAATALGLCLLAWAALPLGAAAGVFLKLPGRAVPIAIGGLGAAAIGFLGGAVLYTILDSLIQALNPKSAMPDLGVAERDARDIAAYLSTLK